MAPKRSRKGKGKAKVADAAVPKEDLRLTRTHFGIGLCNQERIRPLIPMVANSFHEGGKTEVRPTSEKVRGDAIIFSCFLLAGMVPPLSEFCQAVLETYGLVILQLHPNAVMVMAIFAHLCEAFVGVMPSVALFRHYYAPRVSPDKVRSGGVTWSLRSGRAAEFLRGAFRTKWEEWRGNWCHVHVDQALDCFVLPEAPAVPADGWSDLDPRDGDLRAPITRIKFLRNRGLTSNKVVADYLWRRLAPLQRRSHPVWAYQGPCDRTRTWPGAEYDLSAVQHKEMMKQLFGKDTKEELPENVVPLHCNNHKDAILGVMPPCNARGIDEAWEAPPKEVMDRMLAPWDEELAAAPAPPEDEPEGDEAGAKEGETSPPPAPPAPVQRRVTRSHPQTSAATDGQQGAGSSRGGPSSRQGEDSSDGDGEPLILRRDRKRAATGDAVSGAPPNPPRLATEVPPGPAPRMAAPGFLEEAIWVIEGSDDEEDGER